MTTKSPTISPADLKKLLEARSKHAIQEFKRIAEESAWRSQLLAPFIPPTPANPKLADLDARTRHLIESAVQHAPGHERRARKPTMTFDGAWTDVQPSDAAVDWYGPDAATGRVGAKLVSQAQGDRSAACLVCKLFTADRDGPMKAYAQAVVSSGYEDTGGIGPSSARSQAALGIWVDQFPDGPFGLAYAQSTIWDVRQLYPAPGFPYFDSSSTPSECSESVSVSCDVQAGATYAVWVGAAQFVGTWGPVGAQSNLDMNVTQIHWAQ